MMSILSELAIVQDASVTDAGPKDDAAAKQHAGTADAENKARGMASPQQASFAKVRLPRSCRALQML